MTILWTLSVTEVFPEHVSGNFLRVYSIGIRYSLIYKLKSSRQTLNRPYKRLFVMCLPFPSFSLQTSAVVASNYLKQLTVIYGQWQELNWHPNYLINHYVTWLEILFRGLLRNFQNINVQTVIQCVRSKHGFEKFGKFVGKWQWRWFLKKGAGQQSTALL